MSWDTPTPQSLSSGLPLNLWKTWRALDNVVRTARENVERTASLRNCPVMNRLGTCRGEALAFQLREGRHSNSADLAYGLGSWNGAVDYACVGRTSCKDKLFWDRTGRRAVFIARLRRSRSVRTASMARCGGSGTAAGQSLRGSQVDS